MDDRRRPVVDADQEQLAAAPDRRDRPALQGRDGRVERAQRVEPRHHHRRDDNAAQRIVEPSGGDLDLGQLRH